jgi:hypothetical protein
VTLECRGSSDIAPPHFETGDSFHLRFSEAEILAVTSSDLKHTITETHQGPTSRHVPGAKTSIELVPQHLVVKKPRTISVVTDGDPGETELVGALLNVRITSKLPNGKEVWLGMGLTFIGALGLGQLMAGGTADWFVWPALLSLIVGSTLVVGSIVTHGASRAFFSSEGAASRVMLRSK